MNSFIKMNNKDVLFIDHVLSYVIMILKIFINESKSS